MGNQSTKKRDCYSTNGRERVAGKEKQEILLPGAHRFKSHVRRERENKKKKKKPGEQTQHIHSRPHGACHTASLLPTRANKNLLHQLGCGSGTHRKKSNVHRST